MTSHPLCDLRGLHGRYSTYVNHGCRCDECSAARRAYQRESGGNRRAGARGESKRRADENLKHPCGTCGDVLVSRKAELCVRCRREQMYTEREIRRRQIEALWRAGRTLKEIAATLGSTPGAIGVAINAMRATGEYDVPLRRPRKAVAA